jgi:predicted PhzF superfamily epimerase YddE/YHI9
MATLPIFIIDAFADRPLTGNPAAVVPLDAWLPDALMQAIAGELNLSETVFFVPEGGGFAIRWFTPIREVDMIGHATLAAGALVLERMWTERAEVGFTNKGATMTVARDGAAYRLEMPALPPQPIEPPDGLVQGLGRAPAQILAAKHYLCVYERPDDIATLGPDFARLKTLPLPAVIVTAPGDLGSGTADFVSRFFAPANGVDEDPVSGVAHLCLVPYWSKRLGKSRLVGHQISQRGGFIRCEDLGPRVRLGGTVAVFLEGRISV